jgi:predicted alpha/beta-fold hydrolase
MEKGLSRIYQYWLVSKLKQTVRQKQRQRGIPFDLKALRKVRTFFEFDDLVTAPLHGFANAADYYARSSSRQFLANITTPTLIVHALDDPFMTPDTAPTAADISPSVTLLLSRHGGHVGFVAGARPWKPRYWAEQNVVSFLAEHLCMPQDT